MNKFLKLKTYKYDIEHLLVQWEQEVLVSAQKIVDKLEHKTSWKKYQTNLQKIISIF